MREVLQPHILLLDIRIPEVGVPEVLPIIWANSPRTKILILAEYFEKEFIARALQHGVYGCVLKTARPWNSSRPFAFPMLESSGRRASSDPSGGNLAPED